MLKLVVCVLILAAVCCAQKHLTCSITDDVLNQLNSQTSQTALQGSPGKRGPKGQVGSRGIPGQKGEPGIPDDRQISSLRDQVNSLSQEMEALKNQSRKTLHLVAAGSKMLYVAPHFYVYQLTPRPQQWQQCREYCQTWGGDLAVHGVKTLENRKKLIENLSINKDFIWIGANDAASEGNWVWINGERVSSSELTWDSGQPENRRGEDYLVIAANPSRSNVGLLHDGYVVNWPRHALCEKAI